MILVADERAPSTLSSYSHSHFHFPYQATSPLPEGRKRALSASALERRRRRSSILMGGFGTSRPASVALCAFLTFLNLFAFLFAVGAERRRSTVRSPFLSLPSGPSASSPRLCYARRWDLCARWLDAGEGGAGRVRRAVLLPLRHRRPHSLRRLRFLRAAAPAGHCHRRHAVPLLRPRALLPRLRRHRVHPLLVRVLNPRPASKPRIIFPFFLLSLICLWLHGLMMRATSCRLIRRFGSISVHLFLGLVVGTLEDSKSESICAVASMVALSFIWRQTCLLWNLKMWG